MGKILRQRIIRRAEDIRQLAHGQTSIIFGKNLLPTGRSRAKQRADQLAEREKQSAPVTPTKFRK